MRTSLGTTSAFAEFGTPVAASVHSSGETAPDSAYSTVTASSPTSPEFTTTARRSW